MKINKTIKKEMLEKYRAETYRKSKENDWNFDDLVDDMGKFLSAYLDHAFEEWRKGIEMKHDNSLSQAMQESEGTIEPGPYDCGFEDGYNVAIKQLHAKLEAMETK